MPEERSAAKVLRRSDRVDETRVGDRVVLYHRDTSAGIVLNPSGSRIWDSLESPASASDIVDKLAREYSAIPRERISADVDTYVSALQEQHLVEE